MHDVHMTVFEDHKRVPVFDEDIENPTPPAVEALRCGVEAADAVIFSTPEYNQSLPGSAKNLIDWLSRFESLDGKPVAIVGATTGPWGTRIAQSQLRHALLAVGSLVMPGPSLFVRQAGDAFNADAHLVDPRVIDQMTHVVEALVTWVRRLDGRSGDAAALG
jgi:chromate reductase